MPALPAPLAPPRPGRRSLTAPASQPAPWPGPPDSALTGLTPARKDRNTPRGQEDPHRPDPAAARPRGDAPPARRARPALPRRLPAGAATPAPPVGTALGPHGINIVEFTKAYNEKTQDKRGQITPPQITPPPHPPPPLTPQN